METDEEITGFLEEPIKGWGKWFVALSPVLFMLLILSIMLLDEIDSSVDISFFQTVFLILIFVCICIIFVAPFVGLAHNLPSFAYPVTGFFMGLLNLVFYIYWFFSFGEVFPEEFQFASELVDRIYTYLQDFMALYIMNFVLCILMTLLVIWIRRSKNIAVNVHQNIVWFIFLFYCSALILPIPGYGEFITPDVTLLMVVWYVPLGLGIWLFLRLSKLSYKYGALVISTFLEYGLGALWLYRSCLLHPPRYLSGWPFWLPALVVAIEGLFLLVTIALPAFFEFMLYLRSVVEEEVTIAE